MKLNTVSILFFDCVSKKTDFDFSESVVRAVYYGELFPSVVRTSGGIDKEGK